jgi:hypothetical protein
MTALWQHLSYANVMATIAVFIALGGGAYALSGKNTVASDDIINGQVKSDDIGGSQVKTGDIGGSQVTGGKVAADTLGSADIGAGAIGGSELLDGSLTGADVDDSTLFNDNSLNLLDIDEGSLYNDNSLDGGDINESTLFNDDSLTGADINESSLAGLHGGSGKTEITGGSVPLFEDVQVPVADGQLRLDCGGGSTFGFVNQSGQPVRLFLSNRETVLEDNGTAGDAQVAMSTTSLGNGLAESMSIFGVGNVGHVEATVLTDSHVIWGRAVAFSGATGCDYVIWAVEEPI